MTLHCIPNTPPLACDNLLESALKSTSQKLSGFLSIAHHNNAYWSSLGPRYIYYGILRCEIISDLIEHRTSHFLEAQVSFTHKGNISMQGSPVILYFWSKHLIQQSAMISHIANHKSIKAGFTHSWIMLWCDSNFSILCDLILTSCYENSHPLIV